MSKSELQKLSNKEKADLIRPREAQSRSSMYINNINKQTLCLLLQIRYLRIIILLSVSTILTHKPLCFFFYKSGT